MSETKYVLSLSRLVDGEAYDLEILGVMDFDQDLGRKGIRTVVKAMFKDSEVLGGAVDFIDLRLNAPGA